MLLKQTIDSIGELYQEPMKEARKRLDNLLKPPGSLGVLEELAVQLVGITGKLYPVVSKKVVIVMAGDHGVVAEGVSAAPQEITCQILPSFIKGTSGIGVIAHHAGAKLVVVDIGVASPVNYPGVLVCKVKEGTKNIALGPAMSRDEAIKAIEVGIKVAQKEVANGANLLATGDMGIGNTTPSSAILAVLGRFDVEEVTGRGTFISNEILARKKKAIARSLEINKPDPNDALDVLAKVGGLEIAGLTGVILGAAATRVPVLLDGFITCAAALITAGLQPKAKNFMIASHLSEEPGHRLMLELMGLAPMLQMKMRLGEGTGATLAMPIVEAATKIYSEMATFEEARVATLEEDMLLRDC